MSGSNSLTIENAQREFLVSYNTVVGVRYKSNGRFFVTNKDTFYEHTKIKWSRTTAKHVNHWLAQYGVDPKKTSLVYYVEQTDINQMAGDITITRG